MACPFGSVLTLTVKFVEVALELAIFISREAVFSVARTGILSVMSAPCPKVGKERIMDIIIKLTMKVFVKRLKLSL